MITIKNSNGDIIKEIDAELNKTLLKQLEAEWISLPAACYTGMCWACMCHIESWEENVDKSFRWEPWFPLADEEVMTCIAWLKDKDKDIVLKTIY